MVKYYWFKDEVPAFLEVRQVYGIVFSSDEKILLRISSGKYKLTGGKKEVMDTSFSDTLKREYFEEVNVEIEDIHYLGYLLVEEKNERYAQVRMIARIKTIGPMRADLDTGEVYERIMVPQESVKKYLNYSDLAGNQMLDDAIYLAHVVYK